MISTRLLFLVLAFASFAPAAISLRPGWVAYYYGVLLVCWVLVAIAAAPRAAPEDQSAEQPLDGTGRRLSETANAVTAGPHPDAASYELARERLIIVAREQVDLYGRIRSRNLRRQLKDTAVRIITDRRVTQRRRQMEVYIPDRRRAERRHYVIEARLRTQGWVEVRLPES